MLTAAEERRQRLAEINTKIGEYQTRLKDPDYEPSLEEEAEHEALVNARADIRTVINRRNAMIAAGTVDGRDTDESGTIPDVIRSGGEGNRRAQTFGERFTASGEYQDLLRRGIPLSSESHIPQMERYKVGGLAEFGIFSDLITGGSSSSAGAFITADRQQGFEVLGRRPLNILDFISRVRTGSDTIEYVRQLARTNNAAPVAEATSASGSSGVKPESGFTFEVVQDLIRTIANWMPVTRQAVRDVPQMRDLIDTELRDNLLEELEDQIIAGDGTGQNFTGIANVSGTQAQAWDSNILTTLRRARTKVVTVGRTRPTAYGLHPNDWEDIDLLQDNEARYYFGGPSVMGTPRLWGLPVFENEAFAEGVGYVANWQKARLWDRQETEVLVSDSHQDFFIRNLLAILAELRAGFGVLQPSAFVEIDLTA